MVLIGLMTSGFAEEVKNWEVSREVFSLSLAEAAKLKRSGQSDAADYARLVKMLKTGEVKQEEFLVLRTPEDRKTATKEVTEVRYPEEYEPPQLPHQIGSGPGNFNNFGRIITPATPAAFRTKDVGNMMEVQLKAVKEGQMDLALTLSLVSDLGSQVWGKEKAESEVPRFVVQKLQTDFEVTVGAPSLLGSVSPPEALQPKEGERRVWLAFVTLVEAKE